MAVTETLEFAVLGPLEARAGGKAISLGSPKQRALLALFLLHANERLSRDRLIDELWGDSPPATANSAFHVYLSRLRKLLGERLERDADGYRLRVDPDQLDVTRFEQLAREGHDALADGEPERAAGLLHEALHLWRGPPLAGLTESFASAAAGRLEEQYLSALEDRIDADLAFGRHHSLVAELDTLCKEHPYREQLRAKQMLALYRSGRQADALAAYQQARRTLGEELGLDPSPELRALEQAILRHDPALDAPDTPARAQARGRRLPIALIAAGTLVVGGAAAAAVVLTRATSASHVVLAGDAVGMFAPDNGRLRASIDIGGSPTAVTAGAGSIWTANVDDRTVSRIDPRKRVAVQTIAVGDGPDSLAFGGGFVWVANGLDGTVSKIDPNTDSVVQTIAVGNGPSSVATNVSGVWVANASDGTVTQLDAKTGDVRRTIGVARSVEGIAAGDESVWVTTEATGSVVRIDARTGDVSGAIHTGSSAGAVAVGHDAVWVANDLDGTVTRIDPTSETVRATITVGDGPSGITPSGDSVWVSNERSRTLSHIDAKRNTVVGTVDTGSNPEGVVLANGVIFVPVRASGVGHYGGTLRIVGLATGFVHVDPALAYYPDEMPITILTNDGLTAFRRVGGRAGTRLVPDLALALPAPTDGGRTYRFKVRPGIRYSTGALVQPQDFRAGIERTLRLSRAGAYLAPYYAGIVGASRCLSAPKLPCDLSEGIVVDPSARTVTFHLATSDPDFLYKLALPPAFAVPVGTALHPRSPVPATGPYRIASFRSQRFVRLVRNSRFHEWSSAAQPKGFPDTIVERVSNSSDPRVAAVLGGSADVATGLEAGPPSPRVLEQLRTQHASRLKVAPSGTTFFLALNTRRPPFDDVRARRALNFALDRRHLERITVGAGLGGVTCQILPPNFFGYRRYCPYTAHPVRGGGWTAPDLIRARRLVRASGTSGTMITVWIPQWIHFGARSGRYVASVLESIGYKARVRTGKNPFDHADKLRLQAGFSAWHADYAAASGFVDATLVCDAYNPDNAQNVNFAEFCDRQVDREVAEAESLQQTDPEAASRAWAIVDRDITDRAPWVAYATGSALSVVSPRVHNFQYNPQWGTLFDRIWVR